MRGPERLLLDGAARILNEDRRWGTLYRLDLEGDAPLVMVRVLNATPEPDGSIQRYYLRVPPTMERAREAVAWTFGKREYEYAPEKET